MTLALALNPTPTPTLTLALTLQAGALAVRVAPNGQQFTPAGEISLELYAPPQVTLEPQLEPQPQP